MGIPRNDVASHMGGCPSSLTTKGQSLVGFFLLLSDTFNLLPVCILYLRFPAFYSLNPGTGRKCVTCHVVPELVWISELPHNPVGTTFDSWLNEYLKWSGNTWLTHSPTSHLLKTERSNNWLYTSPHCSHRRLRTGTASCTPRQIDYRSIIATQPKAINDQAPATLVVRQLPCPRTPSRLEPLKGSHHLRLLCLEWIS